MSLTADTLLDRLYLKRQVNRWRILAIFALVIALLFALPLRNGGSLPASIHGSHIARVSIEGMITDDIKYEKLFQRLKNDSSVKAAIIRINSPGGSVVGGQQLYLDLRKLAEQKPVVVSMRSTATSAAYMAALGGDYIYALEGTITGSIGVILQMAEFTEMAKSLGINPITVKSGPYKASPSPLEKFTDKQRRVINEAVEDSYNLFVSMVANRRDLPTDKVRILADGRVYTGTQALKHKLIDAIGGEDDAKDWLIKEKGISEDLEIMDENPEEEIPVWMERFAEYSYKSFFPDLFLRLDGLVSIWHPNIL